MILSRFFCERTSGFRLSKPPGTIPSQIQCLYPSLSVVRFLFDTSDFIPSFIISSPRLFHKDSFLHHFCYCCCQHVSFSPSMSCLHFRTNAVHLFRYRLFFFVRQQSSLAFDRRPTISSIINATFSCSIGARRSITLCRRPGFFYCAKNVCGVSRVQEKRGKPLIIK